jgi:hypothetical protein
MSVPVVLVVLVGSVLLWIMLRSGENRRFETCADPHQIVMAAVGIVAAKRRWQTMERSDGGASFRYHKQPNPIVAVVLLMFLLVPGIVYLVLASKRESLVVTIDATLPGINVVQVTSNGYRGKFAGRALQRQLALAAGALGTRGTAALASET